jgi:hypothetical protein
MKKHILFLIVNIFMVGAYASATRTVDADSITSSDKTKTFSLPSATDTIVGRNSTDTLASKTLSKPVVESYTTSGMNAISSPQTGMVIYNSDVKSLASYDGTKWVYGFGSVNLDNTFSAKVSSAGVVSGENTDWIDGNCTSTSPYTCTFKTGLFSVAPNCFIQFVGDTGDNTRKLTSLSTSVQFRTTDTTPATINAPTEIFCQKAGVDYANASSNVYIQSSSPLLTTTIFSATVSNTGVVSGENLDWINGDCTNANPSVCTYNSGIFTTTPNCWIGAGNVRIVSYSAEGSGSISIDQYDDTGTPTKSRFTINCQRTGADYVNATKPFIVGSFQNYVKTTSMNNPKMGSAKISAGGVALVDNGDMILGNCSLPGPTGRFLCNFETGFFTSNPVCTATQFNNSGGTIIPVAFIETLSNTAIEVRTVTSGAYSFDAFFLMCHGE